ncbi:hypothetical protein M3Y96_01068200 [Aphelenchoides besseyi]|nr:hypothetical protein M3Y96_01068200 [Aphelenchoides besseyi]
MSKPQLTTYSKAILLMHRNEYVCNRPPDNELSALEFFKYLLISRQFLQASQLHQVYEFAIFEYSSDDKKFYVSSMKGKFDEVWATGFKLTLEEIRTWNQLLDVQYVRLYRYHYKYADEFSAVSKLFRGYITLDLYSDIFEAENHSAIIRQVQKQLYSLDGHAKSMIGLSEMPRLNLMSSFLSIGNLYQFKQVLTKHQIKELVVQSFFIDPTSFDPTIDDNFFDDFPTCPSVKKLKFTWRNLDEMHNIVPKVTKMMPFFPNLCQLYCYTSKYHAPGEFSLQKLVVWIRDECRKIEELQKASLSLTDVVLVYNFKIRKAESKKVVKQLVKEILNTTEFKVLRFAKLVMPGTEEHKYNGFIRPYCKVELWREQPNGVAALQFKVDLDPLTLDDDDESEDELSEDESAEHRDN